MANIIFDYDGTLHNSMKIYEPAFRKTCKWLSDNGYIEPVELKYEDICCWLGFNSTDMWSNFQPNLDPAIKEQARKLLGEYMAQSIENGEAELYPHTEEVLTELREKGHHIIYLSNCRIQYMERHKKAFGLERFIDDFYCCEEYDFIPKYQIFRLFSLKRSGQYIVVGDRFHDIETAEKNGLKAIGCGYGYGKKEELLAADIIVSDITEIPQAVDKLTI